MKYDLIIVGAGPVGSHLARITAEQNWDVLIIERSDEVGTPLACSGHVSPDIWNFVPKDSRQRLLQNHIEGARFHNKKEYRFYKDETVSYVIDRIEFDKVKFEDAVDVGADYVLGEEVLEVIEKEDRVEVVTSENKYTSRYVAGCDGASSTVREELGLPEPDHFYQGFMCFTDEDDSSDFVDVHLQVPEFFGWRIPRGGSVEYGVAVPKGKNPKQWLENILEEHGISDAETRNFCGGAIPIGPADKTYTDRGLIIGDAAGQTKPFTGGGILYGMRSAEKAAKVLLDGKPLSNYGDLWREELEKDIMLGKFIEKFYSFPRIAQNPVMWFFQGEIGVHMDKPTSIFTFKQLKSILNRD